MLSQTEQTHQMAAMKAGMDKKTARKYVRARQLPSEGATIDRLTKLLVKLVKTGAKVVHHASYVIFQMAELAVSTNLFAAILARIRRWAAKARAGPMTV